MTTKRKLRFLFLVPFEPSWLTCHSCLPSRQAQRAFMRSEIVYLKDIT